MATPSRRPEEGHALDDETAAETPVHLEVHGRRARTLVLAVATAFSVYLCYRMAAPFALALTGSLTLAVLFAPLQKWLEAKLKRPGFAAVVSVLAIGSIVVVPVAFVVQQLIVQAAAGAELIDTLVKSGQWRRTLEAQPFLAPVVEGIERQIDLPGTVTTLATGLSATAGSIIKGSLFQVVSFALTFYLLFFLLRDRRVALATLRDLSPLTEPEMDRLLGRVGDTIYATVYGTITVSALQGLLGGLMFWWLGLPAPFLWGLVMALVAAVPVLGAFIVWVPAALFLALDGSWGKALILALWGLLVVSTSDNLLRPILVGNRLRLHTVLAFLSLVGGLVVFGPAGLILGPVALTITTVLLEIWPNKAEAPE